MNLKSIEGNFNQKRFAYLIVPSCPIANDVELYAAVHKEGRAVIREFKGSTLELGHIREVSPEDFQREWRGD